MRFQEIVIAQLERQQTGRYYVSFRQKKPYNVIVTALYFPLY